jgi:hypothetical protein
MAWCVSIQLRFVSGRTAVSKFHVTVRAVSQSQAFVVDAVALGLVRLPTLPLSLPVIPLKSHTRLSSRSGPIGPFQAAADSEVRLSPLGTSFTNWPIVPAPDDRWWWMRSSRWNENWQGKPEYSEKNCPSATLLTTNHTWPELGLKPNRRGGKPATNSLSYGTAFRPQYQGTLTEFQRSLSTRQNRNLPEWLF